MVADVKYAFSTVNDVEYEMHKNTIIIYAVNKKIHFLKINNVLGKKTVVDPLNQKIKRRDFSINQSNYTYTSYSGV